MRLVGAIGLFALAACAPPVDPLASAACATRECTCDSYVTASQIKPLYSETGDAYCPEGYDLRVSPKMVTPPVSGAAPIPEWRFR